MINIKNANAMSEVLHYLKGIRKVDIDKLPKKLLNFLEENASKDYICDFDYSKPLRELKLLDDTKGILGLICLNYWCETEEEKNNFKNILNENEIQYQKELREKYNVDNIFKNSPDSEYRPVANDKVLTEVKKETIFTKIKNWLRNIMNKRKI